MQSLFTALLERIKEPLRPDRGVRTDSSILLIYPPEKELDFREATGRIVPSASSGRTDPVHAPGSDRLPVPESQPGRRRAPPGGRVRRLPLDAARALPARRGCARSTIRGADVRDAGSDAPGFLHRRAASARAVRRGTAWPARPEGSYRARLSRGGARRQAAFHEPAGRRQLPRGQAVLALNGTRRGRRRAQYDDSQGGHPAGRRPGRSKAS